MSLVLIRDKLPISGPNCHQVSRLSNEIVIKQVGTHICRRMIVGKKIVRIIILRMQRMLMISNASFLDIFTLTDNRYESIFKRL